MVAKHFLTQFLRDFVQDDVVDFSEYETVDEGVSLVDVCDVVHDEVLDLPPGTCESKLIQQIKVIDAFIINDEPESGPAEHKKKKVKKRSVVTHKENKPEDVETKASQKPEKLKQKNEKAEKVQQTKRHKKDSHITTKKTMKAVMVKIKKDKLLAKKLKVKENKTKSFKLKIKSKLKLLLPKKKLKKIANPINLKVSKTWTYKNILENRYKMKMPKKPEPEVCNCPRAPPGEVGCGEDCINRMTMIECHPSHCINGEQCSNNDIQLKKFAPGLQRFMTKEKGWGVRAQNTLRENQYVLEYTGEVVDEDTFEHRMKTRYKKDTHHYCMALGGGLYIDAHRTGSECRFVNHSCEPNAIMEKWTVGGLSRMALFTTRKIRIGEEITYDYNFENYNSLQGQPCKCGTESCRGIIGARGATKEKPLTDSVKLQPVVKLAKCNKSPKSSKLSKAKKKKRENLSKLDYRKIIKNKFPHRPVNSSRQVVAA